MSPASEVYDDRRELLRQHKQRGNLLVGGSPLDALHLAEAIHLDPKFWSVCGFLDTLTGYQFDAILIHNSSIAHLFHDEPLDWWMGRTERFKQRLAPKGKMVLL